MIASWKDLCVDAVDPQLIGRFWAGLLGRSLGEREDGTVLLTGPTPRHTVWINQVPEPVTAKQRVHLDVHAADHRAALALGATPEDVTSFRWQVLRDPEGGELCVFEREEVPEERLYEIVVDGADPAVQARWWAEVLGGRWEYDAEHGVAAVEDIPGVPFEYLVFVPVPEAKTLKNRIHWDVDVSDVRLLAEHGATVLRGPDGDIRWTVLADPEGNEFCAFAE
ncbi:VOC family protein [Nocardioides hungaricus]